MYKGLNLNFEYAIKFSNGKYFTGPHNHPDYFGEKVEAYTYTASGAYGKIASMINLGYEEFIGASVEKIK